ncbi:predicted protein [Pyrenophora tritici-repentis Pt-1C-BFP]|uniref:Uncharacterized protein n=1 Tax=Pyrenophora tritici-repentis (strain Pt-1C-BFP) TaxID=426418 RepID=B2WJH9_PYRTR|nr:uncharacterized protein PTRG_10325 [Pyrenophora tritici-repentis Pt-1C-BFP]EDU43376.1 predicted protein [Pyrenophora tritici-repentis Pt-1C-BFP]
MSSTRLPVYIVFVQSLRGPPRGNWETAATGARNGTGDTTKKSKGFQYFLNGPSAELPFRLRGVSRYTQAIRESDRSADDLLALIIHWLPRSLDLDDTLTLLLSFSFVKTEVGNQALTMLRLAQRLMSLWLEAENVLVNCG